MPWDIDRLVRESFVAGAEHHPVLGSTNDRAKQLAAEPGWPLPYLVVADRQTAGRGRGRNRWWTGSGSLAMSLLVDGRSWPDHPNPGPLVALAAAVAAAQVVAPLAPAVRVGIHWPNDVFVEGKKLAGVLVEAPPGQRYVVGVGLNLNNTLAEAPLELQSTAVTLRELTGKEHDPTEFVLGYLKRLAALLDDVANQPYCISQAAAEMCLQRGASLLVETGGQTVRGVCQGIATDGALLLATPQGLRRIASGVVLRDGRSEDS